MMLIKWSEVDLLFKRIKPLKYVRTVVKVVKRTEHSIFSFSLSRCISFLEIYIYLKKKKLTQVDLKTDR